MLGAEPFTKIKYTIEGKEVLERVIQLNLHKEYGRVVQAVGESGKSVCIRVSHLTEDNLKIAFALQPKILHLSGHGLFDFNKD
jgi:hypothetical protein